MAGPTHDAAEQDSSCSLATVARRVGASRWVEERLFETLGAWVQSTPDAAVKITFARHSHHAVWRAAQWAAIQSEIPGFDADSTTTPANGAVRELFDALAGAVEPAERVAAMRSVVLPGLAESYAEHAETLGTGAHGLVAGGPVLRTLHRVRHDLASDVSDYDALDPTNDANTDRFIQTLDALIRSAGDLTR